MLGNVCGVGSQRGLVVVTETSLYADARYWENNDHWGLA
jgi:hypothetical protein